MTDKRVYTDGRRTVEFYHIFPAPHSDGLLVAYFPQDKILFQGDFSVNPGQPANEHVRALVAALERLGIDYDRYINVHASAEPQTRADVMAAIAMGRSIARPEPGTATARTASRARFSSPPEGSVVEAVHILAV